MKRLSKATKQGLSVIRLNLLALIKGVDDMEGPPLGVDHYIGASSIQALDYVRQELVKIKQELDVVLD